MMKTNQIFQSLLLTLSVFLAVPMEAELQLLKQVNPSGLDAVSAGNQGTNYRLWSLCGVRSTYTASLSADPPKKSHYNVQAGYNIPRMSTCRVPSLAPTLVGGWNAVGFPRHGTSQIGILFGLGQTKDSAYQIYHKAGSSPVLTGSWDTIVAANRGHWVWADAPLSPDGETPIPMTGKPLAVSRATRSPGWLFYSPTLVTPVPPDVPAAWGWQTSPPAFFPLTADAEDADCRFFFPGQAYWILNR